MPNSNPAQPAKQATSTATSALSISTVVDSLTALADRINAEHAQVLTAFNVGLDHALQAGRLLQQAKKLCPHGTWARWLKDNFRGSACTARGYMLAVKRFPRLKGKMATAANLSLRQVALLTTAPKQKDPLKIVQRVLRMLPPVSELTTIGEVKSARDIALERYGLPPLRNSTPSGT